MARSSTKDPLEKFRFQVSWASSSSDESTPLVRMGFHDIQLPKRTTNKIMYREGNDTTVSSVSAGLSTMDDVVMSRGLLLGSQDANKEFYKWMSSVHSPAASGANNDYTASTGPGPSDAAQYRKELTITMFDREGNPTRQWILYQAFPTHFVPGSDLSAREDGDKSLEALTVSYEDFVEIDTVTNQPV